MLEGIRNLKPGWILLMMGVIVIISGISMKEGNVGEKTLLCFDKGCIYIQGMTNIIIGVFIVLIGVYNIFKK